MLQAELRVASGKQSGHVIPLVDSRFLIGREEDCHLRPNSDLVSRHHCVFKVDDYSLRVRDLGSTNGTLVNGERLRGEVMLNTGDRVTVGKLEFEVAIGEAVSQPVAAPSATADADATDAFEMGETPSSPSATMEIPSPGAANPDETIYQEPAAPESQTMAQETVAFQGDTMPGGHTPQPPMQPPGYGQQPIGYSMPYPQQQPQFPYAQPYGMPMMGYPQQPAYPQMGMYPQQNMPPQVPQQAPQQAPEPVPDPAPPASSAAPEVRLPDPAETGAKPPEPKPQGNGQAKGDADTTRDTAADIIKQYTQRRPQT